MESNLNLKLIALAILLVAGSCNGMGPDPYDSQIYTPEQQIIFAIGFGDAKKTEELLKQKVDPNTIDPDGRPLLSAAVIGVRYDLGLVPLLLQHGADINGVDRQGKTAEQHAIAGGNQALIKYLQEYAAKENQPGA